MKRNHRSLLLFTLLFSLSSLGCFRSTGGTEVGIRIGKIFGQDRVVSPGTTVVILPVLHDWYLFDTKTQTLEMRGAGGEDLDFKTRDGNDISVDVTILYHIDPAQAPQVLHTVASSMAQVRNLLVRPLARSIPRDALNELSSEEFYDSGLRAEKEGLAHENLRVALGEFGIVAERVVLGNYRFHDKYQDAIDAKKVADQAVNKNRSAAETAIKEWERELEKTKGQVSQIVATQRGKAQQVHLQAEAYYEARQLEAEAILAEKKANAQGIRKLKEAVAGAGGRTMVKLRIADALQGKRIVLYPSGEGGLNLQRLDVNDFLATMGVVHEAGGSRKSE